METNPNKALVSKKQSAGYKERLKLESSPVSKADLSAIIGGPQYNLINDSVNIDQTEEDDEIKKSFSNA